MFSSIIRCHSIYKETCSHTKRLGLRVYLLFLAWSACSVKSTTLGFFVSPVETLKQCPLCSLLWQLQQLSTWKRHHSTYKNLPSLLLCMWTVHNLTCPGFNSGPAFMEEFWEAPSVYWRQAFIQMWLVFKDLWYMYHASETGTCLFLCKSYGVDWSRPIYSN